MPATRLLPYDRTSPLLEEALRVYARVWPERDREEARENFTRYAGYDAFRGLVAFVGEEAVGVGYGARSIQRIAPHDGIGYWRRKPPTIVGAFN